MVVNDKMMSYCEYLKVIFQNVDLVGLCDPPPAKEHSPGLPPCLQDLSIVARQLGGGDQLVHRVQGQESILEIHKLIRNVEMLNILQNF